MLPAITVRQLRNAERKLPDIVTAANHHVHVSAHFAWVFQAETGGWQKNWMLRCWPPKFIYRANFQYEKYLLPNLDQRLKMDSSHRNSKQLSKKLKTKPILRLRLLSATKQTISRTQ